ncbi:MAG: hypothetical protein AABX88_02640 [Nanoarchaeota archaeon]
MTIKPICNKCGNELNKFGGILLGPPDENNKVEKLHLCKDCYEEIVSSFES